MSALFTGGALALVIVGLLIMAGTRGLPLALAGLALAGGVALLADSDGEQGGLADGPTVNRPLDPLTNDRFAFMGRFTPSERWLGMADSIAARGKGADAANILVTAVKQYPGDYSLWVGLGNMLTAHGGGLNPGARLAYDRAIKLAPAYPAPRYFLGVAEARSGNVAEARRLWTAVLADAPASASWRPLVEDRLAQTAPPAAAR